MKICKTFLALLLALLLPLTALAEPPVILLAPELVSMVVDTARALGVELSADSVFRQILPIDDSVMDTGDTSWYLYDADGSIREPINLSVTFDPQNRLKSICCSSPATDAAVDDLETLQAQFQTAYIVAMDTLLADPSYTADDVFFITSRALVNAASPDGDWRCFLGLRGDGSRPWDNALLTFLWHPGSDRLHAIEIDYVQ